MLGVVTEDEWWDSLEGEDVVINAHGVPPYDVDQVASIIEDHILFDGAVLDFGCGPGRLGHELARRHPNTWVHGVDVSLKMLERSRVNAPKNWTTSTRGKRPLLA